MRGTDGTPAERRARESLWEKVVLPEAVGPAMQITWPCHGPDHAMVRPVVWSGIARLDQQQPPRPRKQ